MIRKEKEEQTFMLNQNNARCCRFRRGFLFSFILTGAISMAITTGTNYKTVLAADDIVEQVSESQTQAGQNGQKAEETTKSDASVDNKDTDTYATNDGVYDFKDNKTSGTVTVTKKWDDGLTNEEREVPDINISTKKPSKSAKGYTVTFHGNGLKFADGTDENMVVYNSSGQIVEGSYKTPNWVSGVWYSDEACTQKVEISDSGIPQIELNGDLDLWAKEMTFEIKGYNSTSRKYNDFNYLIPDTVTEIIFTDEAKPKAKEIIDVDADGDGGVVAWLDDDAGTIMKVSTQIPGVKVQAAKNSGYMFDNRNKLQKIDLKMLDTQNVTSMYNMFNGCSKLTSLDLSPLDTQNVTSMSDMFSGCFGLTALDLSPLDTQNVTSMYHMFYGCSKLTSLDLSPLDTQKVTDMSRMFSGCSSLASLDLSPLDTQKVTDMSFMFNGCSKLTSLDLSPLDTQNVANMSGMFNSCSGLTTLDLSPLDTQNVTNMSFMLYSCSGLTALDLSSLDTQKVTSMYNMFYGCSKLTSLDLSSLDTQNVTNMSSMFSGCSGLTALDLSPLDTQKVTNMSEMFNRCSGLTSLDLSPLDTQNVTDMDSMFYNCSGLTSLDLSHMDTHNVTDMYAMFGSCFNLTSLDLTSFNTQKVTDMKLLFANCFHLATLTTGTTFKFVGTDYSISGTWQNTAGETFTKGTFPSNVADTYTRIS